MESKFNLNPTWWVEDEPKDYFFMLMLIEPEGNKCPSKSSPVEPHPDNLKEIISIGL